MAEPHPPRPRFKTRKPGGKQRRFRERLTAYRASRQGHARRRLPPAAVPSFFTLMNLFSGFLAVTQVHSGRFDYACWLIVLAGFFDVLDGMMARLTNSHSLFGTELDSLADIVSFGTAPAYLVYAFGLSEFGPLGLIVASLPAVCGAVRLARFNVNFDGTKKEYFSGLPIPGQAIILCALILNFNDSAWFSRYSLNNLSILIPIVFVLSFLMVSAIPFDAVPKPTPGYIRAHPRKAAAYGIAVLLIVFLQQIGLFVVLVTYLLFNIGRAIYRLVLDIMNAPPDEYDGETDEGPLNP
ncbi:MAG TPA: CDP-diacylglycerol--serine O-phosphatidyltransferase [Rhodothermales bacterium]|nr:CDP-diacylglycerol--serine O-phosphatidyltransferase [Rhodothermales bacterium]